MWFKNIVTGLEWRIESEELIDRLRKDSDYEVIEVKVEKPVKEVKQTRKKRGE